MTSIVLEHGLVRPIKLPFELPAPIYGAMLAIWHMRPVLQRRFPLHEQRVRDYLRFLAWCAAEGRRQYVLLREIEEWDEALNRPLALPALPGDAWTGHFSVAMFLFGICRQHYSLTGLMTHAPTRARVAKLWWRGGRIERRFPAPPGWQLSDLRTRFQSVEGLASAVATRADSSQDAATLIAKYHLDDIAERMLLADGAPRPAAACLPPRIRRAWVRLPLRALKSAQWLSHRFKKRPAETQLGLVSARIPASVRAADPQIEYPFGVNLFGYARGEIGIGEDVRLMAKALKANGIPFCVINLRPGPDVSQKDHRLDEFLVKSPVYAINVFCVTGIEHVRFACEHGLDLLRGRYTIGMWPWELPHWPSSCEHAYGMVDEIWGISRYTAEAYANAPCPVSAMTLSVELGEIADESRARFGLPEDAYLFYFPFDLNSTLTRKNPEGVVKAFQRAFPVGSKDKVGLIIKANHPNPKNKEWVRFCRMVRSDDRIRIVDETLRYPSVLGLYRVCDCLVSLHRAEGFGRSIAEAMLLGKQVVTTGFSGNLDFTTPERVALVRYSQRPLKGTDYFHAQGQYWADPDLDHAAELMREVRMRPRPAVAMGDDFSPAHVGRRYVARLLEIKERLKLEQ